MHAMRSAQIEESLATAEAIKSAIAESGLSKKKIADEMGVTPPAVQGWERTGRITPVLLRQLGKLLKKNLSGQAGLITELPPLILSVVELMTALDDEGRQRIYIAAKDAAHLYSSMQASSAFMDAMSTVTNLKAQENLLQVLKLFPQSAATKQHSK